MVVDCIDSEESNDGVEEKYSNQKRFFIALSLYPFHFSQTLPLKKIIFKLNHEFLIKGISCQFLSTMYIFDLYIYMYICNLKIYYFCDTRIYFFFYFITDVLTY